jgi:hypothetical protein
MKIFLHLLVAKALRPNCKAQYVEFKDGILVKMIQI